jgi:transposase
MGKYKKKVKLYSEEDLDIAVRLVMNKNLSDRKAAKQFNVGRQMVGKRGLEITGVRQEKIRGRKNMISSEQEIELGHIITEMAETGFAVTPKQILSIVIEYAETNQIKNPYFSTTTSSTKAVSKYRIWRPTRRWLTRFIERNNLSRKRTKGMHIARFRNIRDPFLINNFYDLLGNWLSKLNLFNR